MVSLKITKFLGKAPRLSPELLPDTAAQIAKNCKLQSGDLVPYPKSFLVSNVNRTGIIKTLYALRNPDNFNDITWLSWTTDVHVVEFPEKRKKTGRFYYTGDGSPKVSDYKLATSGTGPYPINYYDLGLPLPSNKLITTATFFTTKFTSSFERDAGNIAKIVTSTPHGLRTGNIITISGFNDPHKSFNASNVVCTVINPTTFTYFSPGPQVPNTAFTDGKVDLAGLTQARSYVFTWFTPWGEESIASKPSDNLYIKEGITVTVSNLPTAPPFSPSKNFIRGIRLYRTVPSVSGTEYFLLKTLWFPNQLKAVQRINGVSRVTLVHPHNLGIDDRFKISGCFISSFDITNGFVTNIIDDYTFEYQQINNVNISYTLVSTGTLYYDVSENPPDTLARYWGDDNYDFIDDFDSRNLNIILRSDDYDPPPENLKGLTILQNGVFVGFTDSTLYFSEPNLPHAWPKRYAFTIKENIVAIIVVSGVLLVLTKGRPYIVSVSDPASGISATQINALYPCLSARSVVLMDYGVVWATTDGLAAYSPSSGITLITKMLYENDTWMQDIDPTTIVASYYGNNLYFASHSRGAFIFEHNQEIGGIIVDVDSIFTAPWYDSYIGILYFIKGTNGDVYAWDVPGQAAGVLEWKSKVIKTQDMINLGAARVIADYRIGLDTEWNNIDESWNNINSFWSSSKPIKFKLWIDKKLIFSIDINNMNAFRLPTGYRTDTFEVSVEGDIRVRAIHLSETMLGLKAV